MHIIKLVYVSIINPINIAVKRNTYTMGELPADVREDLAYFCQQQDGVLHFNYRGLEELPRQVLEDPRYRHVRRIYLKMNRLNTLVRSSTGAIFLPWDQDSFVNCKIN